MWDVMALFAGGLRWVLWVGRVKGVVVEVDESVDASISRSEIPTFFNAGFSLLVVRQSGLFVPSLLSFGLVGKSGCAAICINFRFYRSPFYVYGFHALQWRHAEN